MYILTLLGCQTCGGSLFNENEMHCDHCLIKEFEKRLNDVKTSNYLDNSFKIKLIAKYEKRLNELKTRN